MLLSVQSRSNLLICILGLCAWIMVTGSLYASGCQWVLKTTIDQFKQVAANRTQPHGRILGVDLIPAQPPKGVSTIQGNFFAPEIQTYIRDFLRDPNRGRPRQPGLGEASPSTLESNTDGSTVESNDGQEKILERTVDVVLSDMSEPWYQTSGFWKRSLSAPYHRMMNTSGVTFRDHAGSMVCHTFVHGQLGTTALTSRRIFEMQLYVLARMFLRQAVILSASSTKAPRIKS